MTSTPRSALRRAEAVAYIVSIEDCAPEAARNQISEALDDGALWPSRWADARPTPRGTGGLTGPDDLPARYWNGAATASINWQAGTALDCSEYCNPPRQRRLLVHRLALRSLGSPAAWDAAPVAPPTSEDGDMAGKDVAPRADCGLVQRTTVVCELATGVPGRDTVEDGREVAVDFVETTHADGVQGGFDCGPAGLDRIEIERGRDEAGAGSPAGSFINQFVARYIEAVRVAGRQPSKRGWKALGGLRAAPVTAKTSFLSSTS